MNKQTESQAAKVAAPVGGNTPGPWTIGKVDPPRQFGGETGWDDHGGYRIDAPGVEQLAYVWNTSTRLLPEGGKGPVFGSNDGEANARLIAAAPTMAAQLAAVEKVLAEFEGMTGAGYRYMAANIRTAIARATGAAS